MIRQFLVEWDGFGFYAKAQPTYNWCFTRDVTLANGYKSLASARGRAIGSKFGCHTCQDKPHRIVEVDGNFKVLEVGEWVVNSPKHPDAVEKGPPITLAMLKRKS